MVRYGLFTLSMLICIIFSTSCRPIQASPTPAPNMPNPASVYCEQNGGNLDLRTDATGGVSGVCIFPDGSECDEWAYFRKECKPGDLPVTSELVPSPVVTRPDPTATADLAGDRWKIYRNSELGYNFHYPADAQIVMNDEPLKSISILGPEKDGERWPAITISHPGDREEYCPPEGVALLQWLTDHNLIADERVQDVQIAGTAAIHLRHARSPQSYADDRYYFARAGQLYTVIIGHTADKEDWVLYNHFLESFQFDR